MLDGAARRLIGPSVDRMGSALARRGVSADAATIAGFVIGLAAAAAIAWEQYGFGLALILASRLFDGLDGAIARHTAITDRGGYLDIVLDFAFYGSIPLAFALARPQDNALPGAILLFSFYVNGSSFLAYATIAAKRGISTTSRGQKSLHFTTGLAEATETIAVFGLFCLLPRYFAPIAISFSVVCLVTAAARIALAVRTFR